MSACIIAAQVVMVPVAFAASRLAASWGRKPVFLIGLAVLPVRGMLYCLSINPVLPRRRATPRRDRRGDLRGRVGPRRRRPHRRGPAGSTSLKAHSPRRPAWGRAASNLVAGYIVKLSRLRRGLSVLAAIAIAATVFFAMAMPETGGAGRAGEPLASTAVPRRRVACLRPRKHVPGRWQAGHSIFFCWLFSTVPGCVLHRAPGLPMSFWPAGSTTKSAAGGPGR